CDETNIHQNYKDLVLKASDIDTKVKGRSTGHPVRTIRNQLTKLYLKMEADGATLDELEQLSLGSLRKAVLDGDKDMGSFMAGQISGLLKEQMTVKDRMVSMMDQAEALLGGKK
ncbi:MAG: nitronate monooxygenase, partial [Clostridiales bacterium]|nr:nitronate monooxygenase [Clostridiales bacterium]